MLSGKVFEYLAAERPIIGLVPPEGAAAELLRSTGSDWIADPDDIDAIRSLLSRVYDAWQADDLHDRVIPTELRSQLDRRTRAAEIAAMMEEVCRHDS